MSGIVALALAVANRVLALEYSFYSVISPEGCASILWKSADKAAEAAARLMITGPHLLELGIVDALVPEPPGGAHQDHDAATQALDQALTDTLHSTAWVARPARRVDPDTLPSRPPAPLRISDPTAKGWRKSDGGAGAA